MTNTDKVEWILYAADLTTRMRILPVSTGHLYFEVNGIGTGEVKIPLDSEAASVITSGMFIQNEYRGAARGGFIVENIKETKVDAGENAGRWMSISGKDAFALLDNIVVWDDESTETTRTFSNMTKAAILIQLLQEAQTRGALSAFTWDFTAANDSDSVAWGDSEEYQVTVGDSVLRVAQSFAETGGFDFSIALSSGQFVLSAYKNGIGSNKSSAIIARAGTNCLEIESNTHGDDLVNVYLVKYKNGYTESKDAASITANGRREKILNAEIAQTLDSASTYASAKLAETKDPKTSHTIRLYDGIAPFVFVDFILGDTITYDVQGTQTSKRVLSMQVDYENENYAGVILELDSVFYRDAMKRARDVDYLLRQLNTARDANLLEVRQWVPLSLPTDTISDSSLMNLDLAVHGDTVYFIGGLNHGVGGFVDATYIKTYNMVTGQWGTLSGGTSFTMNPQCIYVTPNGKVYVGVNGGITELLYIWDGSAWDSMCQDINIADVIYALAHDAVGNNLYIGGQFGELDSVVGTYNLARLDLSDNSLHPLGSGRGDAVYALYWDETNSRLIIGGDIPSYNNICTWDGSSYAALGSGLDGIVRSITMLNGKIIAGGEQTGYLSEYDSGVWSTVAGAPSGIVRDLQTYLSDLYVAGDFSEGVVRLSGGYSYSLDGGVNDKVTAVGLYGQTLIAIGDYTVAGGKTANKIAAYFTSFEDLIDHLGQSQSLYDLGAGIHGATEISTPLNADEFPLWKSSVTALRKVTWANIKATLKTYFDTLYVALTGDQTVAGIKRFSDSIRVGIDPPIAETDGSISQAQEGVSVGNTLWTWGTGLASFVTGIFARGTKASPTAAQADDVALKLRGRFHDGTGYGSTSAEIRHVADETHTATAHGTRIELDTTPNGSTTRTLRLTIESDGRIWVADEGRVSADNGGAFQRTLERNLVLQGDECLVTTHINFNDFEVIFEDDGEIIFL